MRTLPFLMTALLLAAPAAAQDRPLYNAQGRGGTTLFNSTASGAQPLSLKQITQGKNSTGYSYERSGTGYVPYNAAGAGSGDYPTLEEVEAFRNRRAAQAQASEQAVLGSLANGHQNNNQPSAATPVFPGGPAAGVPVNAISGQNGVKKVQRYEGRDTGVRIPPKVFNSVR